MKKIALISLFLFSSTTLFSATDKQIINHFKRQIPIPGITIKIAHRKVVSKDIDYVSVYITDGKNSQKVSVFTKDDYIFPDVIDIKRGISLKDKIEKEQINRNIAKLYKDEKAENIISLGNDPKKETIVIFSDPECPFCKKELNRVESMLKKYNIKMIFTPVHDRSSLEKSYLIYKQTKDLKDDNKKIAILKKYFNQEADEKVSDENVQKIELLRQKYFKAGIQGTPYKVMEKELLK
jgi:thiol:disulfide interchange protein DsbC